MCGIDLHHHLMELKSLAVETAPDPRGEVKVLHEMNKCKKIKPSRFISGLFSTGRNKVNGMFGSRCVEKVYKTFRSSSFGKWCIVYFVSGFYVQVIVK